MISSRALPADHPLSSGLTSDSLVIQNYRGFRTAERPIWLMRQAGRSLPEYRRIRAGIPMLDACLSPELVTEITLQPVRRHGVDAAIFFSDIVVPLKVAGIDTQIVEGLGPVIDEPIRSRADLHRLRPLLPEQFAVIGEAVSMVVAELGPTPLIGFAGAPFTLASYLIEGRPSRDFTHTFALMRTDSDAWHQVLAWAAEASSQFLKAQVLAGASAIQVFDSWAGALDLSQYTQYCAPHSAALMASVSGWDIPRVHFGVNAAHLLLAMREVGATVMGVDAHTTLDAANATLGGTTPLQGNINPALLDADWDMLSRHVGEVLRGGDQAPGHVVNLGHGVPKDADPDVLTRIVDLVHDAAPRVP